VPAAIVPALVAVPSPQLMVAEKSEAGAAGPPVNVATVPVNSVPGNTEGATNLAVKGVSATVAVPVTVAVPPP
jgi:hypothetical protein